MSHVLTFLFHVITGQFRKAYELVRHLRLGTQLSFVGLGLVSYGFHQYPNEIYLLGERGYYIVRLGVSAGMPSNAIPLSTRGRQQLSSLIETLRNDLTIELMRRDLGVSQGYNTWAVAQTVVGLASALRIEPSTILAFFERNIDENCACWHETPEKQPHTGATGWTIYSISALGLAAPPIVLNSLLDLQSREGWWALHPAKPEPKSASTYSTAWATLALCSQVPFQSHASTTADTNRMQFAVTNALNWLDKNELGLMARWKDYPANAPSITSVSISGLVTHVKTVCDPDADMQRLHRQWLERLPLDILDAASAEASNTYLLLANGALDFDRTRHYVLQWALVATVDAYASGSLAQRARALQWIERILRPSLISPEVRNQNWVAAELLYALTYLQKRVAVAPDMIAKS